MMSNEILGSRLATWHKLFYFVSLLERIRESIRLKRFHELEAEVLAPYRKSAVLGEFGENPRQS